jgi:cysteine desulfurase
VAELRNILEKTCEARAKETIFVGKDANGLPNTSCFATPGWKGETQVMQMDLAGFAVSAGSACSSGQGPGQPGAARDGLRRVAASRSGSRWGPQTTEDEVLRFARPGRSNTKNSAPARRERGTEGDGMAALDGWR